LTKVTIKTEANAAFTLTVLTTRNETWRLWKWIFKFQNSNFMPAI